jgi:hypothetical protein
VCVVTFYLIFVRNFAFVKVHTPVRAHGCSPILLDPSSQSWPAPRVPDPSSTAQDSSRS